MQGYSHHQKSRRRYNPFGQTISQMKKGECPLLAQVCQPVADGTTAETLGDKSDEAPHFPL